LIKIIAFITKYKGSFLFSDLGKRPNKITIKW